jgi:putative heme degradation protein
MPSAPSADLDHRVRLAAFSFHDAQRASHGDVLSWRGFDFDGQRVALLSMLGILKPGQPRRAEHVLLIPRLTARAVLP